MDAENVASDSDLDAIIATLNRRTGRTPRAAIRQARENRNLIVPRLIEAIREAVAEARAGRTPEGRAPFLALFLLTEFRAKEALPAIVEAVSLPGELPFDIFGDAITEALSRVLAALADDQPGVVDGMIGNRRLNEFVRWKAVDTFLHFVRDERMHRQRAVRILHRHLRQAIKRNDDEIAGPLVIALEKLAAEEAIDDIRRAFCRRLVDEMTMSLKGVEARIHEGERHALASFDLCDATGIDDTIAELETWAAFRS